MDTSVADAVPVVVVAVNLKNFEWRHVFCNGFREVGKRRGVAF